MPWGQFSSCAWNSFHFLDSWVNIFHQMWKFWLLSLQIFFLFSLTPTSLQWFQLLIYYSPWSPTVQWCSCIFEYLFFSVCFIWILSGTMHSNSLVFSSAMSNLSLTPSQTPRFLSQTLELSILDDHFFFKQNYHLCMYLTFWTYEI